MSGRSARWLAALWMMVVGSALAGERLHSVAPGESLEDIALLYYRNPERAEIIQIYNRLDNASLPVGKELMIPVVDQHVVVSGDSWPSLADRYWGDKKLHRELARQVAGSADAPLRVQQRVVIPVLLSYRLRLGETLAGVSRRFYGHSENGDELARFNGIHDPTKLAVGTPLRVPLPDLGPPPSIPASPAPDPDEAQVSARPPASEADRAVTPSGGYADELRRAINAYLDGSYASALQRLETVRPSILASGSDAEQILLLRHLVYVYVAFDRVPEACESLEALRKIDPDVDWNPDEVSPKILGVVGSCRD